MSHTPTLINMPDPPSGPDTPSEMPGTPNSTTTSLSALSTTAIKDGHRGANHTSHHHLPGRDGHLNPNTLEAERADRISRLAGLERVSTTARQTSYGGGGGGSNPPTQGQIPGYFDAAGNPVYTTKMSTVGSASATGSVGGGRTTTWASGSARADDEMSLDSRAEYLRGEMDEARSVGQQSEDGLDGMSDVGFGEGAGSTVSGPTYARSRLNAGGGVEAAERIVRDRLDDGEGKGRAPMGSPDEAGLGKFYFEERK